MYKHVLFGQPETNEGIESFSMSVMEFDVLGNKILTHLGARISHFKLVVQLFELHCTALTDLNAFLILEELAILIEEVEDPESVQLLQRIAHAFNQQVYREFRAVAYLVA